MTYKETKKKINIGSKVRIKGKENVQTVTGFSEVRNGLQSPFIRITLDNGEQTYHAKIELA